MFDSGGSNLAIGISLILRDRFTTQARNAGNELDTLESKARRLQRQQMSMARDMNTTGALIGAAAIRGMGQWYRDGTKFGYTMKYVSTLAEGGYKQLSNRATQVGEDTIFAASQVADGMRWMAQSGMKTKEIYSSIGSIAELATATLTNIGGRGGAADWVTNISKAFKIPLNESNVTRVSDLIASSVNNANLTLYDYGEAMKYAQSTAKTLGITLEETSAAIMVMGNAGMQGSMAGTAFENALRYISKAVGSGATSRQKNALSTLGLSASDFKDAKGNLIDYGSIMLKIGEASKKLQGNVAAQGAFVDIFGVRGARNAALLIQSFQDYERLLNKIQNSQGYTKKVSDEQMNTAEGGILQLISTWETFKVKFAEALEPVIIPIIKGLRLVVKLFNNILSTNSGKMLAIIAAGFVTLRTAVMGYRAIVMSLRLAHLAMGGSMTAQTGKVVSGYNAMTAAANRYGAAATRAGMGGMVGGVFGGMGTGTRSSAGKWLARRGIGKYTGQASNGAKYILGKGGTSTFTGKAATTGWSLGKAGGALGKFGKFAGKASLPAMIAGMALEGGSQAAGSNTGLGKGLGIAGDTLGYAGTGAMIGSIIPGVGTAVGALVGGIGGLLYSLTQRLDDTTNEIEAAKNNMTNEFDEGEWRRKVQMLRSMPGDMSALGFGPGQTNLQTGITSNSTTELVRALRESKVIDGDIIINIDGESKMKEAIQKLTYKSTYNLSI